MAVQLGFDGAVKLESRDAPSIRHVLDLTLDRYVGFTRELSHALEPEIVYWRIVFALLSVHTSFEANEAAYLELRKEPYLPDDFAFLAALIGQCKGVDGSVVQFAGQKASYLLEFDRQWNADWQAYMPNGDRHQGWRDRLDEVRGLARMKASFAVCLADPLGSDVLCIDRHMAALLVGGEGIRERQLRVGEYDAAERRIVNLARSYGVNPFAVQWCLWDSVRGRIEPHASLREA